MRDGLFKESTGHGVMPPGPALAQNIAAGSREAKAGY